MVCSSAPLLVNFAHRGTFSESEKPVRIRHVETVETIDHINKPVGRTFMGGLSVSFPLKERVIRFTRARLDPSKSANALRFSHRRVSALIDEYRIDRSPSRKWKSQEKG
jgi:hypothetical protein